MSTGQVAAVRRWAADPVAPLVMLVAAAFVVVGSAPVAAWAVLGGLAGYALSGSV